MKIILIRTFLFFLMSCPLATAAMYVLKEDHTVVAGGETISLKTGQEVRVLSVIGTQAMALISSTSGREVGVQIPENILEKKAEIVRESPPSAPVTPSEKPKPESSGKEIKPLQPSSSPVSTEAKKSETGENKIKVGEWTLAGKSIRYKQHESTVVKIPIKAREWKRIINPAIKY